MQQHNKTLTNSKGKEIPVGMIKKERVRKHRTVERIEKKALRLQAQMSRTKQQIMNEIIKFQEYLAKQNKTGDVEFNNLALSNYSNTVCVEIKSNKVIEFDENLQLAKAKIDKCFKKWGQKADPNLKIIVDGYFSVDKKGFINKNAILGLFQYKIKDALWNEAMDLIRESINVVDRKQYMTIRFRESKDDAWQNLNLNFSSIEI